MGYRQSCQGPHRLCAEAPAGDTFEEVCGWASWQSCKVAVRPIILCWVPWPRCYEPHPFSLFQANPILLIHDKPSMLEQAKKNQVSWFGNQALIMFLFSLVEAMTGGGSCHWVVRLGAGLWDSEPACSTPCDKLVPFFFFFFALLCWGVGASLLNSQPPTKHPYPWVVAKISMSVGCQGLQCLFSPHWQCLCVGLWVTEWMTTFYFCLDILP